MSVALTQQTPSPAPRHGAEGQGGAAFKAELIQAQPAPLPDVEHLDPKTGQIIRLGELNPATGEFTIQTPTPANEPGTPAAGGRPGQAPLVAPRQDATPQPAEAKSPGQPSAAQPQAPAQTPAQAPGQPAAPTQAPAQPAVAAPQTSPQAEPPATARPAAQPPAEAPRPTLPPAPTAAPQLPRGAEPATGNPTLLRVPGFGIKPQGSPSPRRAEPEAAPSRPAGTEAPAGAEAGATPPSGTAPAPAPTPASQPVPPQPLAPANANPPRPSTPPAASPPSGPAPLTLPGAVQGGNRLPPTLDLDPAPPSPGVTGVRPLPGIVVTHSSGLKYEVARVDVTPVPGLQLVGSNFPETVQPSTMHDLSSIAPGLRGGTFMSTIEGSQSVMPMSLGSGANGAPQAHTMFWSHQNRQGNQPLHISAAFHNPGTEPITVQANIAMSNTTQAGYQDLARYPQGGIPPNTEIVFPDGAANGPGQAAATRRLRGVNDVPAEARTITIPPGGTAFVTLQTVPPDARGRTNIGPEGVGTGTITVSGGDVQVAMLGTNRNMQQLSQEQRMQLLQTAPFMNRDASKDFTATPLATMLERGGTFSRLAGIYDAGEVNVRVTNDAAGQAYELRPGQTMVAAIDTKPPHSSVFGPSQSPTIAVEGSQTPGGAVVNGCGYGQMKHVEIPLVNNTDQPLRVRGTWANLVANTPDSFPTRATILTEWETPGGSGRNEVNLAQSRDTMGREPLFDLVLMPGESGTVRMRFDSPANVTTPWGPLIQTTAAAPTAGEQVTTR